jgi:CSLREA domain-containing protein
MYGLSQYEVIRQRQQEIQQEVAAIRLGKMARANREGRFRVMGDTKWELERHAGLLKKRVGNLKWRERKIRPHRRGTRKMITPTPNRATIGKTLALMVLLAAITLLAASHARASTTFTVNSTEDHSDALLTGDRCDTGYTLPGGAPETECTLRAAIQQANYTTGADAINFAIPGSGVKTIAPNPELPQITEAVSINGYSQPGASANTKDVGTDAVLKIELSGASVGGGHGLLITASNSTVKGLDINRFGEGVRITGNGASGNKVTGNYIGTDATGTQDLGNGDNGVAIGSAPNNTIGGATAGERNVISGNFVGVLVQGAAATGNRVLGNFVGTDKNGTAPLGNYHGVLISEAANNTVGGTQAGARNVVSASTFYGVGVFGDTANGNRVLSNSVFSNGYLGIDLLDGGIGPTANDPGDADTGANNLQNKPLLSSAKKSATGTTTIKGNLNSSPNKTFNVQFFSNPVGTDEGKTFLGSKSLATNGTGNVSFTFSTKKAIRLGQNITATATNTSTGDTSEFSAPRKVVAQ